MKQLLQVTEVACHYLTRAAALGGAFALLAGVVLDHPAANAAYDYAALMSVASAACAVISVLERRIMGDRVSVRGVIWIICVDIAILSIALLSPAAY